MSYFSRIGKTRRITSSIIAQYTRIAIGCRKRDTGLSTSLKSLGELMTHSGLLTSTISHLSIVQGVMGHQLW